MRNLCIDTIRRRHTCESLTAEIAFDSYTNCDQVEQTDMRMYVMQLINQLPEAQRKIMHMRDVEEIEIVEIAEVMNMTQNAVAENLSRARAKIRNQLLTELR